MSRLLNAFFWKDSQGQKLTFALIDKAKAILCMTLMILFVLKFQILILFRKNFDTHDPLAPAVTSLPHYNIIFNNYLDSVKSSLRFFTFS